MYQSTTLPPEINTPGSDSNDKASNRIRRTALILLAAILTVALSTGMTSIARAKKSEACSVRATLIILDDEDRTNPDQDSCFGWARVRHTSGDPEMCRATVKKNDWFVRSKSLANANQLWYAFDESVPKSPSRHDQALSCGQKMKANGFNRGLYLMAERTSGQIAAQGGTYLAPDLHTLKTDSKNGDLSNHYQDSALELYGPEPSTYAAHANDHGFVGVVGIDRKYTQHPSKSHTAVVHDRVYGHCIRHGDRHGGQAIVATWAGEEVDNDTRSAVGRAMRECNKHFGGGGGNIPTPTTPSPNLPTTPKPNPRGASPSIVIDSAGREGTRIRVNGWAFDPDRSSESVEIHAYLDDKGFNLGSAGISRPDVNRVYKIKGNHGFSFFINTPRGGTLRLAALDLTGQGPSWSGSRGIPSYSGSPVAVVDTVQREGSRIRVSGWAFDPDRTGQSIEIHAYLDGKGFNLGEARNSRPDVNEHFGGIDGNHGFNTTIDTKDGGRLCLAAIDVTGHAANWFHCQQVGPSGRSPIAVLDWAGRESPSKIRVRGWAFDPDLASESIEVHAYLNGKGFNLGKASNHRHDVNVAYNIGGYHGFDTTIDSKSGGQLCLAAIDVSGDGPSWFACRNV